MSKQCFPYIFDFFHEKKYTSQTECDIDTKFCSCTVHMFYFICSEVQNLINFPLFVLKLRSLKNIDIKYLENCLVYETKTV